MHIHRAGREQSCRIQCFNEYETVCNWQNVIDPLLINEGRHFLYAKGGDLYQLIDLTDDYTKC